MRSKKQIMVEVRKNIRDGMISLYKIKECIKYTTMLSVYHALLVRGIIPEVKVYRGRECMYVDINDAERIVNTVRG